MQLLGITSVAVITIICYLVAEGVKATNIDNKWVPIICGFVGGVLGIPAMFLIPQYPASDYLTAIAVGIVSGFAATGVHQVGKQLGKKA
jgi:hypothetical protein